MKSALLLISLALVAISPGVVPQARDVSGQLPPPSLYELYSWPQAGGGWDFSLLASPSGVNIPAESIFNKKVRLNGVTQLERRISRLPKGAGIIWISGIMPREAQTSQTRRLALPPTETVEQVKHYAEAHGIQIDIRGSTPE